MPVDPQIQQVLDLMAQMNFTGVSGQTVEEARAAMRAVTASRGQGAPMEAVTDIRIPGPGGEIPIRVYRPTAGTDLPIVVYFHGGGWVIGDVETHDRTCRELAAQSGCVVASVDYRLAPEHPFPAAVEDAFAAVRWMAEHAVDHGADGNRLAVAGDSAGGNLAAVCALLARDLGDPHIRFQLLVYPALDASMAQPSIEENAEGYLLTKADMAWFYRHYAGEHPPEDWQLSPVLAEDFANLPPALVITAEYDPLRDEGELYAEAMRDAGVRVELIRYPGMTHSFFGMFGTVSTADTAMAAAAEALREALA